MATERASVSTTARNASQALKVPRLLTIFAWGSFVVNVIIIATGGAVRLTGSGLGCSEWPLCTPGNLVPTEEQGIHGIIEFGNRTITVLLIALALAVLFSVLHWVGGRAATKNALWFALAAIGVGALAWLITALAGLPGFVFFSAGLLAVVIIAAPYSIRLCTKRRDLVSLAWIVLIGVVAQAFVGGITVLTSLNSFVVGFHYVSSLVLVCVTAAFLVRLYQPPLPRELAVPKAFAILTHITTLFMAVTILFGVLTTASGPHSGDANIIRDGFDATVLSHIHAWPGYISLALVAALVAWSAISKLPTLRWSIALLVLLAIQIAVGVYQSRTGLPPLAVGIHMVLAALTAAAMTVTVMRLKRVKR